MLSLTVRLSPRLWATAPANLSQCLSVRAVLPGLTSQSTLMSAHGITQWITPGVPEKALFERTSSNIVDAADGESAKASGSLNPQSPSHASRPSLYQRRQGNASFSPRLHCSGTTSLSPRRRLASRASPAVDQIPHSASRYSHASTGLMGARLSACSSLCTVQRTRPCERRSRRSWAALALRGHDSCPIDRLRRHRTCRQPDEL